jgi:hypothetical protein
LINETYDENRIKINMLRLTSLSRSARLVRFFSQTDKPLNDRAHILKQKGKGDEDIYFNKKEKEALKTLLNKLEHGEEEEASPEESIKKHRAALLSLARQHDLRLSDVLIDDLVKWRRGEI